MTQLPEKYLKNILGLKLREVQSIVIIFKSIITKVFLGFIDGMA